MAARNAWGNVNPHKPDGKAPRELVKRCRIKCLQMGLNPGITQDLKLALLEIGYESPELQRTYLHPEYLARTAGSWSSVYRRLPFAVKNSLRIEAEQHSDSVD